MKKKTLEKKWYIIGGTITEIKLNKEQKRIKRIKKNKNKYGSR